MFEALVEQALLLLLHGSLAYWPQHSYIGDEMLIWTEILDLCQYDHTRPVRSLPGIECRAPGTGGFRSFGTDWKSSMKCTQMISKSRLESIQLTNDSSSESPANIFGITFI